MTHSEPRLLIIGAGPAGLAAAVAAAEAGVQVLLVDEAAGPGGQYLCGGPGKRTFQTQAEREGFLLIARVKELCRAGLVEVAWGATVWNLDGNLTAMISINAPGGRAHSERVQPGAVVLATGARDTVLPFPGWTLPGVMTIGAAQLLAKSHNLVPLPAGEPSSASRPRILVAGSGLLLFPAAVKLAELGACVAGVLETTRPSMALLRSAGGLRNLRHLAPALMARRDEAWHYISALRKHHIPYLPGRSVVRARASAEGRLEAADVVRLDASGNPVAGSAETWSIDLLCVGHGLVPNVELAQVAGARVTYDAALGGWAVELDGPTRLRTSIPGLFAAGESAGVNGASAALLGGRMAGLSAAVHLGRLAQTALRSELARTARQRLREGRFAAAASRCFAVPDGLYRAIPDETPVCRCEEVTAGQVRLAISAGVRVLDGLKPAVRTGQGLCQGRTCGPILTRILAAGAGVAPETAGTFRVRPPVKPVSLASIASVADSQESSSGEGLVSSGPLPPMARRK